MPRNFQQHSLERIDPPISPAGSNRHAMKMEDSLTASISDFVFLHPHWAYVTVFLLALSEAVPVIGTLVPGSSLIVGISALVPSGGVRLWPLLVAAVVGAIIGDGLSYWLGHRHQRTILNRRPLNRYPDLIAKSEAFLHHHGRKSVFIGRFTPAVRSFIPLFAGILGMPVWRFYVANISSALLWAPVHILPGIVLGASVKSAGAGAGRLAILLMVLVVLLWGLTRLVRLVLQRGGPVLLAIRRRLQRWANRHESRLAQTAVSILELSRRDTSLAVWAGLSLAAIWLFLGILEDVVSGDPLVRADVAIYHFLQTLRTPGGDAAMIAVSAVGDTEVVIPVSLAVMVYLVWRRYWRTAIYWTLAIGFASIINTSITLALHRSRPVEALYLGSSAFSFPSGHVTVNAVLYGFLSILVARQLPQAWRVPVCAAGVSAIALIAFSKLYLGAHWFSDVAASMAFATAWLLVAAVTYFRREAPRLNVRVLGVTACLALAIAGGTNIYRHHASDMQRYAVHPARSSIGFEAWWNKDWQQLPARRIDLTGEFEEPLTFQWAGGLWGLERQLATQGWQMAERWSWHGTLEWFAADIDPLRLPVFLRLERGSAPSLTLIYPLQDGGRPHSRLVLRLWPSEFQLRDREPDSLWVGSVVEEHLYRPLSLLTVSSTQPEANAPRQALAAALVNGRLAARPEEQSQREWDGQVLLGQDVATPVP
ncbi:VTT domain-containing protein [Cupriavidus sp. TMH.W2]|uniref:bifunctional DedA family/phosphatase PAP2 family protein n=1 Tax=Cupriavidus sp. TMH.W2 TaxID=3434465 RepID=UPI003D776B24